MDLRNLGTFIQVAELCSFSKAAEKLGYSQPTISIQIKQLEQELGTKLFDRVGHSIRLTDKGRDMLVFAQRICQMCEEMTKAAGQLEEVSGVIRMATADSLCEPLIRQGLSDLRERYPHLSLTLTTAGTTGMFRMLDHNEVDLVCTLDSHIYDTNYVIAHEEKIGVHVVLPTAHPLAGRPLLTREDLLEQDFLLTEKGMSYRRLLDEWMAEDLHEIRPALEVGSADLICQLVEHGMGISILPDYVTEGAVRRGTIVRAEVQGFHPELWKQILYHRDKWVSQPMRAVIEHMSGILLHVDP